MSALTVSLFVALLLLGLYTIRLKLVTNRVIATLRSNAAFEAYKALQVAKALRHAKAADVRDAMLKEWRWTLVESALRGIKESMGVGVSWDPENMDAVTIVDVVEFWLKDGSLDVVNDKVDARIVLRAHNADHSPPAKNPSP